jgi:hypothetical protein
MKIASLAFFSALALAASSAARAQQTPAPGDRVRITSQQLDLHRQDGRLISMTGDSVVVEVRRMRTIRYRDVFAADTMAVPLAAIDRVEVSRASGRRTLRGALIGGTIAAVLGYVMGSGYGRCDDCIPAHSPEVQGLMGASIFGAGGATIGALVGSGIRWDSWQEIPRRGGGMLLRPLPEGALGVGLTLRF